MLLPDAMMPAERLRLAVPGLAGFAGFVLLPALTAWLRTLLSFIEPHRAVLTTARRFSGVQFLRAFSLTFIVAFFTVATLRAASELRSIQIEAPVLGSSVRGLVTGVALWVLYAAGWSALRGPRPKLSRTRRRLI